MVGNRKILWPERFCITVVWIIFAVILAFLTVLSSLVTCSVYGGKEVVTYGADQPLLHVLCLLAVLAAGVFLKRKGIRLWKALEDPVIFNRILLLALGLCGIWILLTCFLPGSDQRMVYESAQALYDGNYTPWAPWGFRYGASEGITGYAYTYPSQNGLILYFAAVYFVFRGLTPYVLQVMNIVFLLAGMIYLYRLFKDIFRVGVMRETCLMLIGYLPFTFYITFIYGTIPGFFLASMALYYEYRFYKTGKWKTFLAAAVSICAAIFLKPNYLIVLAAMTIYLLTWAVFRQKAELLVAAALLLLIHAGSGRALNLCVKLITGEPVSTGAPMLAWAEMGLQEGNRAPGWYNSYNIRIFFENELDPERTLLAVKEDLRDTLQGFSEDPKGARKFFMMKLASIWAEPTFQSLWIQEIKGDSWLLPGMTESLFNESGILNRVYVTFSNLIQSLVYGGALLFLLLSRRRITWEQMMPAIIFIGGFLFHIVWEAKGQYTVCYFILLIPYAVIGLKMSVQRLCIALKL